MLDKLKTDAFQGLKVSIEVVGDILACNAFWKRNTGGFFTDRADFVQNIYDRYLPHLNFIINPSFLIIKQ